MDSPEVEKWKNFLVESEHYSNSHGTEEFNCQRYSSGIPDILLYLPVGKLVKLRQNSTKSSVKFRAGSGGIPSEFQKVFTTEFTGILLKFHWKIRTNFLAESNWNSDGLLAVFQWYSGSVPVVLRRNTTGIPLDY